MELSDLGIVLEIIGFCFLFDFPRKLIGFLFSLSRLKNRKFLKDIHNDISPSQESINFKNYSSTVKGIAIFFVIFGLIFQLV